MWSLCFCRELKVETWCRWVLAANPSLKWHLNRRNKSSMLPLTHSQWWSANSFNSKMFLTAENKSHSSLDWDILEINLWSQLYSLCLSLQTGWPLFRMGVVTKGQIWEVIVKRRKRNRPLSNQSQRNPYHQNSRHLKTRTMWAVLLKYLLTSYCETASLNYLKFQLCKMYVFVESKSTEFTAQPSSYDDRE